MNARAAPENSSFREDAPRPPVPGEEDQPCPLKRSTSLPGPPRRNQDGLGEPEGSASSESPLVRWTRSLHSLLGDQDGAHLFRTFLEREKLVDTLDFWFACNGFRQMDLKDPKTLRVAKAIHKRYLETPGIVAKQLRPPTKVFIRDCIKRQQIGSTMFDQAQAQIQTLMEDSAYHTFLTSDIYLKYVRTEGENSAYINATGHGSLKLLSTYVTTLNEEEELNCGDLKPKGSPSMVWRTTPRAEETKGNCYRSYNQNDLISPHHVTTGYVFAPTTSANDSEMSSDAMTESSVDGVPPYRSSNKKQQQREMHRSVRANGQVALPHFPRTHRLPREMTPVVPAAFAAELIARLEKVKQEQETMHSLEERLQLIREEEDRGECETPICFQTPRDSMASCDEDPQAILDEHLSRVLKTPGCQSPLGVGRSCSPDRSRILRPTAVVQSMRCPVPTKSFVTKQTTKHIHHHYIHHHAAPRTMEEARCLCSSPADYCCYLKTRTHCLDMPLLHMDAMGRTVIPDRSGEGGADTTTVVYQMPIEESWQRVLQGERLSKHRSHSAQNTRRKAACEPTRASSAERPSRHHQGSAHIRCQHPPGLDTTVVSVGTLTQLEEACRRLAAVSRPRLRCPSSSQSVPCPVVAAEEQREQKSQLSSPPHQCGPPHQCSPPYQCGPPHPPPELTVTYFFCGEEIPYRRKLRAHSLTLGHFKDQLSKKSNYRYYFKKASQEFDCGAVFEEICDDDAILPLYEGRVLGKVERID